MSENFIGQPGLDESSTYFRIYIEKIEGDNILQILEDRKLSFTSFLEDIPSDKWNYRYGADKWTLKESIIHLIDAERVFAYRALRVSRGDKTPMPGFEQDDWVPFYNAVDRSEESVIEEFEAVREATIQLYRNLTHKDFRKKGTASDAPITPLAIGFMIAGHEEHHRRLTIERYLAD